MAQCFDVDGWETGTASGLLKDADPKGLLSGNLRPRYVKLALI